MIVSGESDPDERKSKLKIYDLEAIMNPELNEESALIRTIDLDSPPLLRMAVDDTQIACSIYGGIRVFDFFSHASKNYLLWLFTYHK